MLGDTYLIGVMILLGLWYKTEQKGESKLTVSIYLSVSSLQMQWKQLPEDLLS